MLKPSIEESAQLALHAANRKHESHVSIGTTFWLLRGVLSQSSQNWAHANLDGVWRQGRAVRAGEKSRRKGGAAARG